MQKNKAKNFVLVFLCVIVFVLVLAGIVIPVMQKNDKLWNKQNFAIFVTDFSYTTDPEGYTNKDKLSINVKLENQIGISKVTYPDKNKILNCNGKKVIGIDYMVNKNGTYTFEVEDKNGNLMNVDAVIDNFDRLEPNIVSISKNEVSSGIEIVVTADDTEATSEYSKSGIDKYEYYINNEKVYESTENTFIIQSFNQKDNYIYVIAYDKAGNGKKSNELYEQWQLDKYFIIEVYDHLGSNGASIAELEFYNASGNKIGYIAGSQFYDQATSSWLSSSYSDAIWNFPHLYDNRVAYSSNEQGRYNCTFFMGGTSPNSGAFSRFLVTLNTMENIGNIRVCLGDVEQRTPKAVSAYRVLNYTSNTYRNNIATRNNNGLELIGTKTFTSIVSTPTWYNLVD